MTETQKLGDVLIIRKGRKAAQVFDRPIDGALPYIQIDEVRGNKPSLYALDPKAVEVTREDLCIVWDGANAGTVGYGVTGAIGSTVARMRLREPHRWDARFLGRLLGEKFRELNDQAQARGATIPHVDKAKLEEIELPAIARDEQRRLAAILDKADDIRRKREQAMVLAEDLLRSAYQEIFEQAPWPTKPLAEVVADGAIVTYGIVQAGPEVPDGVPYIRTGDIKNGEICREGLRHTSHAIASKFGRSRVRAGEIVMSIRATVGTTAIVPAELDGANLTQGTARISPGKDVTLEYLLSYLRSQRAQAWIRAQVKGATFLEITLTRLRDLPVPVPPLPTQNHFSAIYRKNREAISRMNAEALSASELFASLSQRAFLGKL